MADCYSCAAKYCCEDFEKGKGRTEICGDFERQWFKEDGEPIMQGGRGWSYVYGIPVNRGEDVFRAHPALYSYELAEAVLDYLGGLDW